MNRALVGIVLLAASQLTAAYPLDGYPYTGIRRLEFYRLAQTGVISGRQLEPGAQLPMAKVMPRWHDPLVLQQKPDRELNEKIRRMLGQEHDRYGVALLDLSDPDRPRYAEHNGGMRANVGSVGKLLVALAVFQKLADYYPEDVAARERVLRKSEVVADRFILYDEHKVPLWDIDERRLQHRQLRLGDTGSLWEYLDWMLSASSNAAASTVMKQLLLISHFGRQYPVSDARVSEFLGNTSPGELGAILTESMSDALVRNGLDPEQLNQGSFFTREGKRRVSGTSSYGTPRELVKFLLLLESESLIDAFSSREIKRLIYMTQKRIRYASHPALSEAAVYFKSGSLYSCVPEPDFVCGKYKGNRVNRLASVAIIESPAGDPKYHYLVAVMSNVLRKNSAVAHQTLAMRIHRMIEAEHRAAVWPEPTEQGVNSGF